jgi:uncharacterized protein YoxC
MKPHPRLKEVMKLRKLTNLDVQYISLVKKGANGEKVTIYKSADFQDPDVAEVKLPEESLDVTITKEDMSIIEKTFAKIKKFMVGGEKEDVVVEKAKDIDTSVDYLSFSSRMSDIHENWYNACSTLRYVGNSVFWSDESNGKELVLKAIDEFKAHVKTLLADKVKKEDTASYFTEPKEPVVVAKTDTLEALKTIRDGLNDSINSLENLEKGVDEQVKKEDFEQMLSPIVKSIEGLTAKVEGLEKDVADEVEDVKKTAEEVGEKAEKTAEETKDLVAEFAKSLEPIVKSLEGISERLTNIEETRQISKQGDETQVEKGDDDDWDGVLFVD